MSHRHGFGPRFGHRRGDKLAYFRAIRILSEIDNDPESWRAEGAYGGVGVLEKRDLLDAIEDHLAV